MRKTYSLLLILGLLTGITCNSLPIHAASAKLNKKKLTLITGNSYTLKVKGAAGKVKWSSSKKTVATVSAKGKVKALKAGKAKISAKVNGKKLTCTVTVKKRPLGKGTKASPKSAYLSNTFTFYEEGKKIGKITMKLEKFVSGDSAAALAKKNASNPVPAADQEYLYFRFRITYQSGTQTIRAKDLFDYYHNIFGENSTKQMENANWGFFFESVDDLGQALLSPGNTVVCGKAVLVKKGYAPYTYRVQTGANTFTWFTTEK